jgi:hypothetical protein
MRSNAEPARGRPAAGALRRLRRRTSRWKRRAHDALVAALIAASAAEMPAVAVAQMGQMGMAPATGIANRAVQGFKGLNENGPGILYYGVNAADRGLGYVGSYMTLGGFVPGFEDDLGGFWAADLRGHLSVNGGFFSNVGAVRKQFLGGSLLGVGVYWDYDGDLNQYSSTTITDGSGSYVFGGGQVYNQVGISGEWLTDFGNLRSNGYIPVGTTAEYTGPFVGNSLLCRNGVNAGLAGTDLEVGAYIPGLTDWAGMISVGGYAYGNARYNFPNGQDVVPWFGGVYTRLDMTFIENWDFSLQYNNDSYFDSTGFARLTYRMGGSRRRNVPDQMEQPMMRNEHIVRAHQTPQVAINPETGTPWRVFHVDNTDAGVGAGTAASPFASLTSAQTAATNPYDIVFVHAGNSGVNPYITPAAGYSFNAANQYLIGQGSTLALPTVSCGDVTVFATPAGNPAYPVITNPIGPAIVANQPGTVVSHLHITGSPIGITDGGVAAPGVVTISDVIISGGSALAQRGVEISSSTGTFNLDRLQLTNLSAGGVIVSADGGNVAVTNSTFTNIDGRAFAVTGSNATGSVTNSTFTATVGTAVAAAGAGSRVVLASSTIADTSGVVVRASGNASSIQVTDTRIVASGSLAPDSALVASGSGAAITMDRSIITGVFSNSTNGDALVVSGPAAAITFNNSRLDDAGGNGALVSGSNARLNVTGSSTIANAQADGIQVNGTDAKLLVQDSTISNSGANGINLEGPTSTAMQATVLRSTISQSGNAGITATNVSGTGSVVQVYGSTINGAQLAGITAQNANIDVGRDPTVRSGRATTITNTGAVGLDVGGDSRVRIVDTAISAVSVGIAATNGTPGTVTNLTARNNTISLSGSGAGIDISGDAATGAQVVAQVLQNRITPNTGGISLTTVNPPAAPAPGPRVISINTASGTTDLSARNFGTAVFETPVPTVVTGTGGQPSLINWNGPLPLLPPTPPPLTSP